jgi:tetratricopeptide (TPR) repeat protein
MASNIPSLSSNIYTPAHYRVIPLVEENVEEIITQFAAIPDEKLQQQSILLSSYIMQGTVAAHARDYKKSLHYHTLALKILETLYGDVPEEQVCFCHNLIGNALKELGRLPAALDAYNRALAMHKMLYGESEALDQATIYESIGNVLQGLGCFADALEKYKEAIRLCRSARLKKGDNLNEAYALHAAASVLIDMRDINKAIEYLIKALSIAKQFNARDLIDDIKCDLAHAYGHIKRYEEALALLKEVLKNQKKSSGKVEILKKIGLVLEALKRSSDAFSRFEEAFELHDKNDAFGKANTLNLMGISLTACSDYNRALDCHKKALELFESLPDEKYQLVVTHNYICTLYMHQDRKEDAYAHFTKACTLVNELYMPGDTVASAFSGQFATLSAEHFRIRSEILASYKKASDALFRSESAPTGDLNDTIATFIGIVREEKRTVNQEFLPVIRIYKSYAADMRSRGEFQTAKQTLTLALELYKLVIKTSDHPEIAICLEALAGVSRELGLFKDAKAELSAALAMRKRMNAEEVALSLTNLATLKIELGEFSEAELALDEASVLPHYKIESLQCQGALLEKLGKFKEARLCYEEVLKLEGPRVRTLHRLGNLLMELGNSDAAMQRFQEAYKLAVASNTSLADSVEHIGYSLGYLGKFHEALEKQKLALKTRKEHFGGNSYQTAESLCSVGTFLHRIGKYEEELAMYEEAYAIQTNVFGKKHPVVADTLDSMGCSLTKLERYDEAKSCLQEALAMRLQLFGEIHPAVALSYDNIGFCHSYQELYEEALTYFQKGQVNRLACYEKDHPLIALSNSYIESCKEAQERPLKADNDASCLLSREEFETLIDHAVGYLDALTPESVVTLEKNPTGFVRLRVPVPPQFSERIETLRLNYWLPEVKIKMVEAPHNHPRYFESMIIQGGYTHSLFTQAKEATSYVASRIFKSSQPDKRNIFSFGKIGLHHKQTQVVTKGNMIAFPRSLIHQVESQEGETMSINAVMKHAENRNYYDVFMPFKSEQDPQADRDYLISDESQKILSKMKAILNRRGS